MKKYFNPIYENEHFQKYLLVFASFDLPTRKLFTADLLNKNSGRYFKESEKLKNIFIFKLMKLSSDYSFNGIDVTFFEKKSQQINYAWAIITPKYSKKIDFSEPANPEEISNNFSETLYGTARDCIRSGSASMLKFWL